MYISAWLDFHWAMGLICLVRLSLGYEVDSAIRIWGDRAININY